MAKRKGKSVSFDAMVKFFLQYHNIPTKKDIDRLLERIDRLEALVQRTAGPGVARNTGSERRSRPKGEATAADTVLGVVRRAGREIGFADIKKQSGFDDKKLRNIIYRLSKLDRIRRVRRGVYAAK
ncbi:MAG: hypothetical protein JEZ11_22420 [Desulfobacterales bacterium]|nr:hypothetical protein [Desulfobacterales bacterium]